MIIDHKGKTRENTSNNYYMQEAIKRQENANKAYERAVSLYPHEKWEKLEDGIFIAKSRMPRS
ncbi:MAG: hypothetical protein LBU82_00760, partial [Treponema sp.]|nr:hypothetical protein [Treponema sp.]